MASIETLIAQIDDLVPQFITSGGESRLVQRTAGSAGITPERFGTGH